MGQLILLFSVAFRKNQKDFMTKKIRLTGIFEGFWRPTRPGIWIRPNFGNIWAGGQQEILGVLPLIISPGRRFGIGLAGFKLLI